MAIPISAYVNVQITRATQGVSRQGFGTPLILAEVSEFYERTKTYAGISEVAEDFGSTSDVYLKAQAICSQNPKVKIFKVGRKYAGVNAIQSIVFDAVGTAGTFTLTVGGVTTATIAYNANVAAIKSAIEALTSVTTVTVTEIIALKEWTVEFTGTDGSKHWADIIVATKPTGVTTATVTTIQYGSVAETWTASLDAVCEFDNDWYGLCITSKVEADIVSVAANIQARSKIFIAQSNDVAVKTSSTTDVASDLNLAGYSRTALIYTAQTSNNLDAGWLGKVLPSNAGEETWAYKDVEGQTVDTYTSSERTYAKNKKANIFHVVGGKRITDEGTMASGEYIDNMISIDFLIARIGEDVWQAITDAAKIPYTDAGVGIIKGILEARLSAAVKQGILDTYSVEVPKVSEISITERANRILPDVNFNARLQGAIHQIEINGKVSV